MPNIRIDLSIPVYDGQPLTFKSPTDCSKVTGLIIYYPEGSTTISKVFQFADAHGNNVGSTNLFASNVLVKVILDTKALRAYVQNADTNAYLEGRFAITERMYTHNDFFSPICADDGESFALVDDDGNVIVADWQFEEKGNLDKKLSELDLILTQMFNDKVNDFQDKINSLQTLVLGGTKIETGSYVGTGTNSATSPATLTFDKPLIFLRILGATHPSGNKNNYENVSTASQQHYHNTFLMSTLTETFSRMGGYRGTYSTASDNKGYGLARKVDDYTIEWYSPYGSHECFNGLGYTYEYIAYLEG